MEAQAVSLVPASLGHAIADLHCHSVHSDGSVTTERIVDFALRRGLTHLALTDHDTLRGADEIAALGARKGLTILPGVECTCTDAATGRAAHLLCYLPRRPEVLTDFLQPTLEKRREAKLRMVEHLRDRYPITARDVLHAARDSASVYDAHILQSLADMGYTRTVCGSLLEELIGKRSPAFVPVPYPDVRDAIAVVRAARGLAVLAHPGEFDGMALLKSLCAERLIDGIECYHPRNSAAVTAACEQLAEQYGLLKTGGSDFHGSYAKRPHPIGARTVGAPTLTAMYERAESK